MGETGPDRLKCGRAGEYGRPCRNVRRFLVRGVNAPLPPEAKKMLKI